MTNVQIAVWLRRETGHYFAVLAAVQVSPNDLPEEVGGCGSFRFVHKVCEARYG